MEFNLQLVIAAQTAERAAALGISTDYGLAALWRIIARRAEREALAAQARMYARAAEEASA